MDLTREVVDATRLTAEEVKANASLRESCIAQMSRQCTDLVSQSPMNYTVHGLEGESIFVAEDCLLSDAIAIQWKTLVILTSRLKGEGNIAKAQRQALASHRAEAARTGAPPKDPQLATAATPAASEATVKSATEGAETVNTSAYRAEAAEVAEWASREFEDDAEAAEALIALRNSKLPASKKNAKDGAESVVGIGDGWNADIFVDEYFPETLELNEELKAMGCGLF
eukprot:g7611.t1